MFRKGPIIIIDDDTDDQEILDELTLELVPGAQLRNFSNGADALEYLETTKEQPFIILCDVNMPLMNGLELLETIQTTPYLKKKCIPFIMLSTSGDRRYVENAYDLNVHGFFKKPSEMKQLRLILELTFEFWAKCLHPHNII